MLPVLATALAIAPNEALNCTRNKPQQEREGRNHQLGSDYIPVLELEYDQYRIRPGTAHPTTIPVDRNNRLGRPNNLLTV